MSDELATRLVSLGRSLSVIHHAGEKTCTEAAQAIRQASETEARLREALRPFAKLAGDWDPPEQWPGDRPIYEAFDGWPTVNDCRAARSALSEAP